MNANENTLKTGTTTMGIVCKDCIILAADKRATAGYMVVNKDVVKVIKINDYLGLTMAGTVSEAQLLIKVIKAQLALKENQTNRTITVKETANMLAGLLYSSIRTPAMIQGIAHFLLAGYDKETSLYDLYPDGSISKIEDFVSSGSGSVYTLGVLESSYKKDMTQKEGIELAKKAINASLKRDTMSGNGFDIAVIDKNGFNLVETLNINTGFN
jgi:proteasome beta subunit